MILEMLRIRGIRCFEDTGRIELSPRCNIFVGPNNAGKSTVLKGILAWQGMPFAESVVNGDLRPNAGAISHEMVVHDVPRGIQLADGTTHAGSTTINLVRQIQGSRTAIENISEQFTPDGRGFFRSERPDNQFVPFIARRKAFQFHHAVDRRSTNQVNGTLQHLYARVDELVSGHPADSEFHAAVREVLGLKVATKATDNGKEAGVYIDRNHFVALDRMGDGVSEMIGLIAELCLEERKVFVLEEPESNIHPSGLKALLKLIRISSYRNQFVIATHSNIVVRELASDEETKIFRVYRSTYDTHSPSNVEEVPRTKSAHRDLIVELGYEFSDLELHDGWLFLEESSAESIISSVLIPNFAPELVGRIRTFSTRGLGNVERSVSDFIRLIAFIHLQPVYQDRLWVRVDSNGQEVVDALQAQFKYLDQDSVATFSEKHFEHYYPKRFQPKVKAALSITEKKLRQAEKEALLNEVLNWSADNQAAAKEEWDQSAKEPILLLRTIQKALEARSGPGKQRP